MSVPKMMFHIIHHPDMKPLCWDNIALEFSTYDEAKRFLDNISAECNQFDISFTCARVEPGILTYEGKTMCADGFYVVDPGDGLHLYNFDNKEVFVKE